MSADTIALFGASGRTGRCVIEEAAGRGIRVRGLVRTQGALADTPAVEVVGSLEAASAVDRLLEGCSSACLVFGPHPPYTDLFCAKATESVLAGMSRCGITRVVCQTGVLIGSYRRNLTLPFELLRKIYRRRQPEPFRDRPLQEELVRSSGLQWTLFKPPRLTTGPLDPNPTVGPDVRNGMLSSVSRATLARLIVDELHNPRFPEQAVFLRS